MDQRALWSVGCPQGLAFCLFLFSFALPCACMWALGAIFTVACSADLCGSLPWTDHCFAHHICSLLAQLSFEDQCFSHLICELSTQPSTPFIGIGSQLVAGYISFSTEVPSVWWCWWVAACRAGSHLQGCHGTSLLRLVSLQGPNQPLKAPVPKLITWWQV